MKPPSAATSGIPRRSRRPARRAPGAGAPSATSGRAPESGRTDTGRPSRTASRSAASAAAVAWRRPRVLVERREDHGLEVARDRRDRACRGATGSRDRMSWKSCSRVSPRSGATPGQRLVERRRRASTRRCGRRSALRRADLLRRGVLRRAVEDAGLGQRGGGRVTSEPEVDEHRAAVRRDADVGRLHVPVDDAGLVGRLERARDVDSPADHVRDRKDACRAPRPRRCSFLQARPGDELHHEVAEPSCSPAA